MTFGIPMVEFASTTKEICNMSAKVIRMVTGETLVSSVTEENGKYIFKKPVMIVPVGKQGEFGMAPWLPLAKGESVTVDPVNVIYCTDVADEIANEYNANFGSGLVVPGGVKPVSLKISGE